MRVESGFATILTDHGGDMYRFTPEALAWLREEYPPTDAEVRATIGRHFYGLISREPRGVHRFDPVERQGRPGLPGSRVVAQAHTLEGIGLLEDDSPRGAGIPTFYRLDRLGYAWAARDFPDDIGDAPAVSVSVDVNVWITITQFVREIERFDVPDERKAELVAAAEELAREPTREKIARIMGLGANAVTMALVLKLLYDNWDAILQALATLPH